MLAIVPSATLLGVEGRPVAVEVHVSNGLPGFTVVGLPDTAEAMAAFVQKRDPKFMGR